MKKLVIAFHPVVHHLTLKTLGVHVTPLDTQLLVAAPVSSNNPVVVRHTSDLF